METHKGLPAFDLIKEDKPQNIIHGSLVGTKKSKYFTLTIIKPKF